MKVSYLVVALWNEKTALSGQLPEYVKDTPEDSLSQAPQFSSLLHPFSRIHSYSKYTIGLTMETRDPILPPNLQLSEAYHLLSLPPHILKDLKMRQGRIGFTCGAFDLLHPGHMLMFKEAKQQCDFLIAGLQTDPSLDRKTKNAPVQTLLERRIALEGNRYVDFYGIYDTEAELEEFLRRFARLSGGFIDVRILDEEYREKPYTGEGLPIEVYYNWRKHPYSTTKLRQRVASAERLKIAA